jgi:subfamily B ATP-binding cassette protein HlyB/CyaB
VHARDGGSIAADEFAWALGALAALHRIPFDAPLLLKQLPPPYHCDSFLAAAQALGLQTQSQAFETSKPIDLPALVLLADDSDVSVPEVRAASQAAPDAAPVSEPQPPGDPGRSESVRAADTAEAQLESAEARPPTIPRPALIVRLEGDQAHYFLYNESSPRIAPLSTLRATAVSALVHFTKRPSPVTDPDARAQSRRPFGFAWFAPELLKHKRLWREVLTGSLVIQVLALTTPIFTQVIIDKVVVHHTVNTLFVVATALLGAMLFSTALSWVRQYLVLHTGNRVDAVLGSRVFEHLVSLPARYFEQRTTGVLVARLHGVETIREFVSGAAVTVLLDLPFLLVFLAIMLWYSWQLTLVALTFLALIVGLSLAVVPGLRRRLNEQFLLGARNQSFLTDNTPRAP